MPKFLKRLIRALIILIVIFVVIPVALAFIFLFDTSKVKITYDDNFDQQKWSKALVVDSLDNTETNKYASFSISESDVNSFIHSAIKDNEVVNKYLSQLAFDIKEDSYDLSVSGKVYFFETRAVLSAKLSKEDINGSPAYVLQFDKLTLGRITKLKEAVMFFLTKFMSDSALDGLTESLNIHFDLANSRAYIYSSDIREILKTSILGDSGQSEFYFTFINDFLDHNLVNIDFYDNESINVRIHLEKLTGNDYGEGQYVSYKMPYDETTTTLTINGENRKLSLNTIRDAIVSLLNNKVIDESNMHQVSQYLFDGYTGDNAPDCDLSSIGIDNKVLYPGFNLVSISSIDDIMSNAIAHFDGYDPSLNSFDLVNLTEVDFNNFLKRQSALGHKYFLQREIETNQNKVNYIAVDNAYFNLTDDDSVISVGLNINGLETWITLELEMDNTNTDPMKLVYDVSSIYYGNKSEGLFVAPDTEKLIYDTLSGAIKEGSFSFKDGKLTIGFDALIDDAINSIDTGNPIYDAAYRDFLKNDAHFNIDVQGDSIEDNALVKIQAIRN